METIRSLRIVFVALIIWALVMTWAYFVMLSSNPFTTSKDQWLTQINWILVGGFIVVGSISSLLLGISFIKIGGKND
jgi:hypothetical protein